MPAERRPRSSATSHDPAPRRASTPPSSAADNDDDERPTPDSESAAHQFRRDFNQAVYDCVRRIPEGKVTSYGRIAHLIGHPRHSRMVGAALKALPRRMALPFVVDVEAPTALESAATDGEARRRRRRRGGGGDEGSGDEAEEGPSSEEDDDDARTPSPSPSLSPPPLPPPPPNPLFVPWHRVLSSSGLIAPRGNPHATQRQAEWLEAEGVVVVRRGGGGGTAGGGGGGGG
ncbi:hypothetical protein JCM8208_004046, partial [Rhodotorula glutinis]